MKYNFNFENREKTVQYNKEKLLLSALQDTEQLYYMMDTQYDGIYQADAVERRRLYGNNSFKDVIEKASYKFMEDRKSLIIGIMSQLYKQKISVFRRGLHFYSEINYEDLVPGDIVFLTVGDIVPSDIRIVFSKEFLLDQSIYTGNSQIIPKTSVYHEEKVIQDNITCIPNLCFVGSTVVGGLARGVVVSTGMATYFSHLLLM